MEKCATVIWNNDGTTAKLHKQIESFLDERLGSSS